MLVIEEKYIIEIVVFDDKVFISLYKMTPKYLGVILHFGSYIKTTPPLAMKYQ